MSSSTSFTICPQCSYAECTRGNISYDLFLACPHCGYCESWVGAEPAAERTVVPGAGCISYIKPSGPVHTIGLSTTAEVENAAQWLRARLSSGKCWKGYCTRWNADTQSVEVIVGKFEDLQLEIPGIDLDDHRASEPGDPHLDPFDTATDTLSDGSPRCDFRGRAVDKHGDIRRARCTRMAATRIRVTASDGNFEAKACASCAASGVKSAGTEGSPLAVEILGEAE
jgi:hypothetical protein